MKHPQRHGRACPGHGDREGSKPQFRYRSLAQLPRDIGGLPLRSTLWLSPSHSAVLALLLRLQAFSFSNSDPALSGAIWYPCAAEPTHVELGKLSVGADFDLKGVKNCPVTGRQSSRSWSSRMVGAGGSVRTMTPRRRWPMPASSLPPSITPATPPTTPRGAIRCGLGIASGGLRASARLHVE